MSQEKKAKIALPLMCKHCHSGILSGQEDQHRQECPDLLVGCPALCGELFRRGNMDMHKAECDMVKTWTKCGTCLKKMPSSIVPWHKEVECGSIEMPCLFDWVGCSFVGSHYERKIHEADPRTLSSHLSMLNRQCRSKLDKEEEQTPPLEPVNLFHYSYHKLARDEKWSPRQKFNAMGKSWSIQVRLCEEDLIIKAWSDYISCPVSGAIQLLKSTELAFPSEDKLEWKVCVPEDEHPQLFFSVKRSLLGDEINPGKYIHVRLGLHFGLSR